MLASDVFDLQVSTPLGKVMQMGEVAKDVELVPELATRLFAMVSI
jgi:hypothetical protein